VLPPFLRSFLAHARWRVAWSAALLVAVALLEAAGLLLLMPLVEMLGLGQVQVAAGLAGVWLRSFAILGVAPGFELVLCSFVGLLILQAVLRRVSDHHNARIEASYAAHLRDRLYASLVRAQWLAFTRLRAADLTRALTQEVDNAGFAAQQGVVLAGLAGLAVVHLTVALILSPPLTALALGCGVAVAVALRPLNRRAHEAGKASQQCRTELGAVISEHLAGFKVAKSHGRSGYHLDLFRRATHAIAEHLVAARHTFSASRVFFELAGWTALMAFLYVAVKWARLELAQLVLMVFVFTRLLPRIGAIQTTWQHMVHYQPAFDAVEKLRVELDGSREELAEATGTLELKREVRLDQVTFRHDATAGRAAVREVSLTIPARRMTALVGASGAGKSTLADLVLGLLSPAEGRVLVDGEPLDKPRLAGWRNSIGYVPQEPFLFHDTIRANLLWARPDATEDDLRNVLRAAAAEEFVARLPQGLDTVVGDRGVRLSGGERQRLTLARALLRRPTLLVLDEATSSLDTENERLVQSAIGQLHGTLTILVIAHRLSTVRAADEVVVLAEGRVLESGSPNELSQRDEGKFRQLLQQASPVQPLATHPRGD
jgi:ATP-binding cassette subfamily C protein